MNMRLRESESRIVRPRIRWDVLLQHVNDPNLKVKIERHGVKALIQVQYY